MAITKIASTTLTSAASVIDLTSIPQSFTDIFLVHSLRSDSTGGVAISANITFNNSATGYTERILYNNPSGGGAVGTRSGNFFDWAGLVPASGTGSTASTFGSGTLYIPNYTASVAKRISSQAVQESNTSTGSYWNHYIVAGGWSGTDAISSVKFTSSAGNFMTGSTVTLYGVTKGSSNGVNND